MTDTEISRDRAESVGEMIRVARKDLGMTQADLLTALGRSADNRNWVHELESGRRRRTGAPVALRPADYVAISAAVSLDPGEVLRAAGIPRHRWPKLSNMGSTGGSVQHIDASGLSDRQLRIVEELVRELRKVPENGVDDRADE